MMMGITLMAKAVDLDAGYCYDSKFAHEHLNQNEMYRVDAISMGQSHTNIYLVGIDGAFNSVHFEFYENGNPIDIYSDIRFNPYL